MHPEITAMAAAEHVRDLRAEAASRASHEHQPSGTPRGRMSRREARPRRTPLRNQTGWALVALGLRIVASGSR
jgi:hypothetical protein